MILASSAVIAIVSGEPEAERFLEKIASADSVRINAATFVESGIVLSHRLSKPFQDELELIFRKLGVEVLPFTDEHRREALDAWWLFGKSRHPTGLNFGECISYATAKLAGEALLFKGKDFAKTDIEQAL